MARISQRISGVAESATLAIDAKAKALVAAGEDVIGFGAGEPDFPTPPHIVAAASAACADPRNHKYTPAGGLPELKEAVAAKTGRDSGYRVAAAQVLITNGGKQAVEETFATLLDPGDEVLLPAPYWTTYPEVDPPGRRSPRRGADHLGGRVQGHRRPARGGADGPDQGAAVRVAVQPDRGRLRTRTRSRPSAAGRSSTASGWSPTRSTSTWSTAKPDSRRCRCSSPSWPTPAW